LQHYGVRDCLIINLFEPLDEFVELLRKIESLNLVIGLGDHDLEDAERFSANVDAREDFGCDIDGNVLHFDDRELVAFDAVAIRSRAADSGRAAYGPGDVLWDRGFADVLLVDEARRPLID
jgi:hypothetical protein